MVRAVSSVPQDETEVVARFSEDGRHAQVLGQPVPPWLVPAQVSVAALRNHAAVKAQLPRCGSCGSPRRGRHRDRRTRRWSRGCRRDERGCPGRSRRAPPPLGPGTTIRPGTPPRTPVPPGRTVRARAPRTSGRFPGRPRCHSYGWCSAGVGRAWVSMSAHSAVSVPGGGPVRHSLGDLSKGVLSRSLASVHPHGRFPCLRSPVSALRSSEDPYGQRTLMDVAKWALLASHRTDDSAFHR